MRKVFEIFRTFFISLGFISLGIFLMCSSSSGFSQTILEEKFQKKLETEGELSSWDEKLNSAYKLLKEMLPQEERERLLKEQRAWLKERNSKISGPSQGLISFYKKRLEVLTPQLIEAYGQTLGRVVTGESTCNAQEGLNALEDCTLPVCIAYKAYFMQDLDPKQATEMVRKLENHLQSIQNLSVRDFYESLKDAPMDQEQLALCIAVLSASDGWSPPQERFPSLEQSGKIPFWLVRAHPKILEEIFIRYASRWYLKVVNPLPSFKFTNFETLRSFIAEIEAGRWRMTSYSGSPGTIYLDLGNAEAFLKEEVIFTPNIFNPVSSKESLLPLESWGFLGLWNYKNYQKFLILFEKAAQELGDFYGNVPDLKMYEKKARALLGEYVKSAASHVSLNASTKAFQRLASQKLTRQIIASLTEGFSQEDFTQALNIAILKHAPKDCIEYLLEKGANPNALVYQESALMKSVEQVEILSLLLQKGAKVDLENPFGKTALFYAIQFGGLESVKLLVEAGADVHHSLKSLKDFEELWEETLNVETTHYLLEKVARFTPLIYALRYGQEGVASYLKSKGALLGSAKEKDIQAWIHADDKKP